MCKTTPIDRNRKLLEKAWEYARDIVRHENDLANHRITAFLSIQAFLFAAFTVAFSAFVNQSNADWRILIFFLLILLLVALTGYTCSWLIEPALRAAFRHVHAAREWWQLFSENKQVPPENKAYRDQVPFPVIIGKTARRRSFWLALFRRSYQIQDEPYDELHLSPEAVARIDAEAVAGIPRLPGFMLWVWAILFVMSVGFGALKFWMSVELRGPTTRTTIKIVEDSDRNYAVIEFAGDSSRIPDLAKRIRAIP